MLRYEIKKILGNRFVVFFFLLMFAVNAILSAVSVMNIPASPETEMQIVDGKLVRRGNIANLPKNATVFNFAWIPAANGKGGDHVVTVTETENLATFKLSDTVKKA